MIATKGRPDPHTSRGVNIVIPTSYDKHVLPIENGNSFYASSWLEGWSQEAENHMRLTENSPISTGPIHVLAFASRKCCNTCCAKFVIPFV